MFSRLNLTRVCLIVSMSLLPRPRGYGSAWRIADMLVKRRPEIRPSRVGLHTEREREAPGSREGPQMVVTQERVRDLEVKLEEDRSLAVVEVPAVGARTRPPRPPAAVPARKVGLSARALSLIWVGSMTALYVLEPVPDETS